jgi:phosphoribosylanthranilate isomerase
LKVKICGITNAEDAWMCESFDPDALGFVHYPSKARSLPLKDIRDITSTIGPFTKTVLVCLPGSVDAAVKMVEDAGVDVIQLYTFGRSEIEKIKACGIPVIRAVKPLEKEIQEFFDVADALLFDGPVPGSGLSHDYRSIPIKSCRRAIIAGGLNLDNLHVVKSLKPYGVDVSSGVERTIGKKDPQLVSEFIRRCRF